MVDMIGLDIMDSTIFKEEIDLADTGTAIYWITIQGIIEGVELLMAVDFTELTQETIWEMEITYNINSTSNDLMND